MPLDTRPGSAAPGLDLQGLLTIDVAAELRKLTQAQFQGPWQLPAELVRRAIRAGARNVSVTFTRGQVVVVDDGAGLDPTVVQSTAILVDQSRDDQERHRALLALERAGELGLLALAGLEHLRELAIQTTQGPNRHTLELRRGMPPFLSRVPARTRTDERRKDPGSEATGVSSLEAGSALQVPGRSSGTQITLRAADLSGGNAARWLAAVARFAPVSVMVNGKPVEGGWRGSLAESHLGPPLRGRLALLAEGDIAHAYLLAHGLVSTRISIPDAPGFEAALELGSPGGDLSPARLREAAAPNLPGLIQQAVGLIVASAGRLPGFAEPQRARLARLTLQAARRKLRPREIERAAVFRCIRPEGPALVDLQALRECAGSDPSGSRTLFCLSPEQRPNGYTLGSEPVLVAGDAERSLLIEVLGARFRTPSRRESSHSLPATARRLLRFLRSRLESLSLFIRDPFRRPALPEEALTPGERELLSALRGKLESQPGAPIGDAVLCAGGGRLRRSRGKPAVLVLPRDNLTVIACVRAFSADPGWLRLIYLTLMGASGQGGQRTSSVEP
jgi:hypothetical protein